MKGKGSPRATACWPAQLDHRPGQNSLMSIRSANNSPIFPVRPRAPGGAPIQRASSICQTRAPFPLFAAGLVGKDALGGAILADCRKHRIDAKCLRAVGRCATSYPDVMTEESTGRRTFFHLREVRTRFGAARIWI